MKNVLTVIFLITVFILCSCSTTSNKALSTSDITSVSYTSLADYLRHNSNVSVKGTDQNIRLQIRGISSVTSDTRPFIYVDKNPVGRDYTLANNSINPNNIKRVEVISSLAKLTIYGQEGHSGIIKIYSKSDL